MNPMASAGFLGPQSLLGMSTPQEMMAAAQTLADAARAMAASMGQQPPQQQGGGGGGAPGSSNRMSNSDGAEGMGMGGGPGGVFSTPGFPPFPSYSLPANPLMIHGNAGVMYEGQGDEEDEGDEGARAIKRPRLVWTKALHKRFVDAVNSTGVDKVG